MKTYNWISILVLGLAVGCAQAPRSPKQVEYQTKASQALGGFAKIVSKGFLKKGTSSSSTRGAYDYGSPNYDSLYQDWSHRNGGYIGRQNIHAEVQDCRAQIEAIPKDCNNLGFMVSSLSRCLNRIISHRNPIFAYGYRQLDRPGQQYYSYLQDWRRPRPVQYYSLQDYQQWSPYASTGWLPNDLMY